MHSIPVTLKIRMDDSFHSSAGELWQVQMDDHQSPKETHNNNNENHLHQTNTQLTSIFYFYCTIYTKASNATIEQIQVTFFNQTTKPKLRIILVRSSRVQKYFIYNMDKFFMLDKSNIT